MTLGDTVTFSATLTRRQRYKSMDRTDKYWQATACAPQRGILIGLRTLTNGYRTWEGSEEGLSYTQTERLPAALVVFALRRKPVLVPLDALETTR